MKFYRWMSNDEFYKMQRGETIYGIDHTKKNNTSSKGVCFFSKEMKVKLVEDEYRNIDVRPVDLTPTEILDLENDTDNEYDGADGNLVFLPAFVNRDVFVEFEMDEKNIIPFLDSYKIDDIPKDKMIESWGVYCKPNGAWADKILVFEYAIDHYDKNILKPTRFVSFNKINYPYFEDIIKDDDFKEYSDDATLNNNIYIKITNENLEEYQHLLDLRKNYGSCIEENLRNLHLKSTEIINNSNTENALNYEEAERRFLKTIEEMYLDKNINPSMEDIRDTCYYVLSEQIKDTKDCDFNEYKYYIEDGINNAFELFSNDRDFGYFLEKSIANDVNTLYVGKLVEDGIEEYSYRIDTYKASQDMGNILKELFSYKKEFKKDYNTETLIKEINEIAEKEGYRYINEDKAITINKLRDYINYIKENDNIRDLDN